MRIGHRRRNAHPLFLDHVEVYSNQREGDQRKHGYVQRVEAAERIAGDVSLDVPSIRGLAAWAGKPIEAAGGGLGPLSINGALDMKGKRIAFKGAEIAVDGMNAKGDFQVDTSGSVPSIVASLELDKLDLNTYLPPESDKPAAAPSSGSAPAGGGAAGPSDWSDDPIDFSALNLVNADLSFKTGAILVKKIKVGPTSLKTVLKGGKLALDLTEMALYDGQGTGRITVDAGRNAITQKLNLKGVQAAPLLTDAAGFDRVEGTANIVADVTTRGASQRLQAWSFKVSSAPSGIRSKRRASSRASSRAQRARVAFRPREKLGSSALRTDTARCYAPDAANNAAGTRKPKIYIPATAGTSKASTAAPKRNTDYTAPSAAAAPTSPPNPTSPPPR